MYYKESFITPSNGNRWLCIKTFYRSLESGGIRYTTGKIYKSPVNGGITDDYGNICCWNNINHIFNLFKYFKQIPRNKRCTKLMQNVGYQE